MRGTDTAFGAHRLVGRPQRGGRGGGGGRGERGEGKRRRRCGTGLGPACRQTRQRICASSELLLKLSQPGGGSGLEVASEVHASPSEARPRRPLWQPHSKDSRRCASVTLGEVAEARGQVIHQGPSHRLAGNVH
eukprot:388893-Rhodomonas_salina.2